MKLNKKQFSIWYASHRASEDRWYVREGIPCSGCISSAWEGYRLGERGRIVDNNGKEKYFKTSVEALDFIEEYVKNLKEKASVFIVQDHTHLIIQEAHNV